MTAQTDGDTVVDTAANGQDTEDVMERMMAVQEEDERQEQVVDEIGGVDGGAGDARDEGERDFDDQNPIDPDLPEAILNRASNFPRRSFFKLHYTSFSFIIAAVHIIYVLRTRKQAYLALLYLTSSKLSYIVIGNMTLAAFIGLFFSTIKAFLNGLRLMETETIVDHIRWNVTETCIALTMFRQEIDVKIIVIFLVLILGKCLHWAVELRSNHLRMTEEIFYFIDDEDELLMGDLHGRSNENNREPADRHVWWLWRSIGLIVPKSLKDAAYNAHQGMPRARKKHVKLFALMSILYVFDVLSLTYCVSHILEDGPSVFIMFLFETSVLFTSIISNFALFMFHAVDSMLNVLQKIIVERQQVDYDNEGEDSGDNDRAQNHTPARSRGGKQNFIQRLVQCLASFWRDHRVTATFVIELMALAAKFLFHLILFVVVFTLYGLPINIIRDFYLAFRRLRERLLAFASYRRLTLNMNSRFEAVVNEEDLDAAGRTCIICRDVMEVDGINGDCIKLPICEHIFHKHCLKEWLVQQQSCPTCRGDLLRNEARARALKEQADEQEGSSAENNGDTTTEDVEENEEKKSFKRPPYPCLYKVNSTMGASLYEFDKEDKCNRVAVRNFLKTLSHGTLVVCIDVSVFTCTSTTANSSTSIYLRTPSGWISHDDLEHIAELRAKPDASPESKVASPCN